MAAGNLLIVDDDANNLVLLAGILRDARYNVRVAKSGRRALATISAESPELVMLDVRMPDLDGFEVCRRLRQSPETRGLPVIFVSALDDVGEKVRAFEAGAVDYLTKPFQAKEVVARVETQLGIARLRYQLEEKNRELERLYRELESTNVDLARANRLLESLSYLDSLTSIPNRRHFDEVLGREWRRCARARLPLSLLMIDIDEFKRLNDTYGHPRGDACLVTVARTIQSSLRRGGDFAARVGGEEFAAILPEVSSAGAAACAEELRARIEELGLPNERSSLGVVTISVGVAALVPQDGLDAEALVASADHALYRAKCAGRNRVEVSTPI